MNNSVLKIVFVSIDKFESVPRTVHDSWQWEALLVLLRVNFLQSLSFISWDVIKINQGNRWAEKLFVKYVTL